MTRSNWNAIMQYSFLSVFANDGTIDAQELAMLEKLALEDGAVDEQERVSPDKLDGTTWDEVCRFKARHSIP
jgi:hypothetical protein